MARLNRNETGADMAYGRVVVSTGASLVADRRSNRVSLVIRNVESTILYWGSNTSLSSANGYALLPDEEYVFDDYTGPVYICSDTAGELRWAEVR